MKAGTVLSPQQRLDLAALMQARAADSAYHEAAAQTARVQYALALNPPQVLNRAVQPIGPVKPKTLLNTALGAALGGMLGVFWVFAAAWWRNSAEAKDK